jgi:methylthioribose-1-phosphate isomerase
MSRVLGIPAVLVVAVVGIYLYTQDAKSNVTPAATEQQAITQAQAGVAATNLSQAAAAMQATYTQSGTYAGATLPVGTGVVLVTADAYSYCLQTSGGDEHEMGPGGQPQPGPC